MDRPTLFTAVIKMDLLLRINFITSMIPLPSPTGYWAKLHAATSKFIWKGKYPCLKFTTAQQGRSDGGLAVPNFKLYY